MVAKKQVRKYRLELQLLNLVKAFVYIECSLNKFEIIVQKDLFSQDFAKRAISSFLPCEIEEKISSDAANIFL